MEFHSAGRTENSTCAIKAIVYKNDAAYVLACSSKNIRAFLILSI